MIASAIVFGLMITVKVDNKAHYRWCFVYEERGETTDRCDEWRENGELDKWRQEHPLFKLEDKL